MALNNSADSLLLDRGRVTAAASVSSFAPSFAVPLVQQSANSRSNTSYVQCVDGARRVVGFRTFEGGGNAVPIDAGVDVAVGGPEVFAVIDPGGKAHAGTRETLAPIISEWVRAVTAPLQRMNFARFCGDLALASESAALAVELKTASLKSNEQATRWFFEAVILLDLLNALAPGNVGTHHLLDFDELEGIEARVILESTGQVTIELPSEFARAATEGDAPRDKIDELVDLAHRATGRWLALRSLSTITDEVVDATINEIRKLTRQEDRIARVFKTLLSDEDLGRQVLDRYVDRATFAQRSFETLRGSLIQRSDVRPDLVLAGVISGIFSRSFPYHRADLLRALARELKGFNSPAGVIRHLTLRSNARDVDEMRDLILAELR